MASSSSAELYSFLESVESTRNEALAHGNYNQAMKEYDTLIQKAKFFASNCEDRFYDRLVDLKLKLQGEVGIIYDISEELSSFKNCRGNKYVFICICIY
jgi:hypothetical protein